MVRLTEDMIVARTRVSDMGSVKKLNCCVNNISTLEDISHCRNLQELYIRKNKIPDISEICWLRDLPRLKNIWLEENPCSEGGAELYRYTVIKTLPQLQKLDNTPVASEEMAEAMRRGLDLNHPLEGGGAANYPAEDRRISREEVVMERKVSRGQYGNYSEQEYEQNSRRESVQSPSRRVSNQVFEDSRMSYSQSPALRGPEDDLRRMSIREESVGRFEDGYRNQRNSYSGPDPRVQQQQYNGNYNYAAEHQARQQQMSQAEMHAVVSHHYNSTYRQVDQQLESAHQLLSQRRSNSPPQRPYPVRPKNRNSNVLSAILCLIKEIDGPSLEVVEMAVRCRMEELED